MSSEVVGSEVRGWTAVRAPASPETSPAPTAREGWEERFSAAVPLFLIGSACLVVAVELYFSGTVTSFARSSVMLRPWILFVALGVTGLGAGIVTVFTEDVPEETPPVSETAAPAPDWDESSIEPASGGLLGPLYTNEDELIPGPTANALPADVVLSQLDEIEESLRRRSRSPPPVE